MLVDLREHGGQSRDIIDKIQARLAQGDWRASRRALILSALALHKMQAQRLETSADTAFFGNEDEAMQWLLADNPAATTP